MRSPNRTSDSTARATGVQESRNCVLRIVHCDLWHPPHIERVFRKNTEIHTSRMVATHCNRRGAAPRTPIAAKIGSLDAPEICPHFAAPRARVRALRAARQRMARPCRCVGVACTQSVAWQPARNGRPDEEKNKREKKRRADATLV